MTYLFPSKYPQYNCILEYNVQLYIPGTLEYFVERPKRGKANIVENWKHALQSNTLARDKHQRQ
jgi:hypothetical protein